MHEDANDKCLNDCVLQVCGAEDKERCEYLNQRLNCDQVDNKEHVVDRLSQEKGHSEELYLTVDNLRLVAHFRHVE